MAAILSAFFLLAPLLPSTHVVVSSELYLPIHMALESFSMMVAALVFAVGWTAFAPGQPRNIVVLACGFLAVALMDFAHMLSYAGMPDLITPSGAEKAINFWLAARFTAAGALLIATFASWRSPADRTFRYLALTLTLLLVAATYVIGIYFQDELPHTFVPGVGLTPLKINLEYALAAAHFLIAWRILAAKFCSETVDPSWFAGGVWILGLGELFFTLYVDVSDTFNLLGHIYKVIGYALIYRAIFVSSVRAPYERLHESQRALAKSEEQLRTILDTLPIGIAWASGERDRLEYANQKFSETFGYTLADVPTLAAWCNAACPEPEHRRQFVARWNEAVERAARHNDEIAPLEARITCKNGEVKDVIIAGRIVLGRVLASFNDVTQRKRAEADMRENATRLRLALMASGQGVYDYDLRSGAIVVSEEYARMLEFDPATFRESHENFFARMDPADRERVEKRFRDHLAGVIPEYRAEFRTHTASGAWKSIMSVGAVVQWDERGQPLRFVGMHTDITAQKRADEHMRLAASIFENTREVIVVTDAQASIISVNRAFTDVTGYSADEVIGRSPRLLHSELQDDAFYQQMWDAIFNTGYWQGELWNRRKDGALYPCWETITTLRDDHGDIINFVSISSDISKYKEAEDRIRRLAYFDPLTGLPNRTLLRDRAEQALAHAQRHDCDVALLFVDLDHFKTINDSLGHTIGDGLLQKLGERLQNLLRDTDTVGRLGGDEFLIVLSELDANSTAKIAQKLLAAMADPFEIQRHSLVITLSIGISLSPRDGANFDELLKNADAALYRAKESGRNAYHFFTPEMNAAAFERLLLENALRNAIKNGELMLYYQPKSDLRTGGITGFEALLRWRHPEMGLISPNRFIPIAEDSGLISPIGGWALREACRQVKEWENAGLPPVTVAVNLSTRQFALSNVHQIVMDALTETALPPERLELEITESLLAQNLDATLEMLRNVKALGVRIAVDDFGTGYSSLAYLRRFPLDKLKIDQSFVRDLLTDPDDRAIAAGVINLGHSLGLTVIAEGVESQAQLECLCGLSCDEAQGFYLSKPLPAEQAESYLRKHLLERDSTTDFLHTDAAQQRR